MVSITIQRVYEPASKQDGYRILVDRVWPRGLTKEKVAAELWLKDAAPSTDLRKWFGHDRERWGEFKNRYFVELDRQTDAVNMLIQIARDKPLVLLFSAHDTDCNQAVALKEYLLKKMGAG